MIETMEDAEDLLKKIEESAFFAFNLSGRAIQTNVSVTYRESRQAYIVRLLYPKILHNETAIFKRERCIKFLYDNREDINKDNLLFPKLE